MWFSYYRAGYPSRTYCSMYGLVQPSAIPDLASRCMMSPATTSGILEGLQLCFNWLARTPRLGQLLSLGYIGVPVLSTIAVFVQGRISEIMGDVQEICENPLKS